jgi:sortase A
MLRGAWSLTLSITSINIPKATQRSIIGDFCGRRDIRNAERARCDSGMKSPADNTRTEILRRARRLRTHRRRTWILAALSGALVLSGMAIGLHIAYFYYRSARTGSSLVQEEKKQIASARRVGTGVCRQTSDVSAPMGIISAPAIRLEAPVLQGTSDAQLDVAVGHDPASVLPGEDGTSVLSAHDVTWFTNIDQLRPGDEVVYQSSCHSSVFKVTGHTVVMSGDPVLSNSNGPGKIVLVTCWPTNALFLTSQRYLVYASLLATVPSSAALPAIATPQENLVVPSPPSLLTLAEGDSAPLGLLSFAGSPDPAWLQSPAPIEVERSLLDEYFAGIRSAETGSAPSWASLSGPNGASWTDTAPLREATIAHYSQGISLTLKVDGTSLVEASMSAQVTVSGGQGAGAYQLNVAESDVGGTLYISEWHMTRL